MGPLIDDVFANIRAFPDRRAAASATFRRELVQALSVRGFRVGSGERDEGTGRVWLDDRIFGINWVLFIHGGPIEQSVSIRPPLPLQLGGFDRETWTVCVGVEQRVVHDPDRPQRVHAMHDDVASVLRSLRMRCQAEEATHDPADATDAHLSSWSIEVAGPAEAASLVGRLLELPLVDLSDPPEPGPMVDLTDEEAAALEAAGAVVEDVEGTAACGSWIRGVRTWLPRPCAGGAERLVDPDGLLLATVWGDGRWTAWTAAGELGQEGLAGDLATAKRDAEAAAIQEA